MKTCVPVFRNRTGFCGVGQRQPERDSGTDHRADMGFPVFYPGKQVLCRKLAEVNEAKSPLSVKHGLEAPSLLGSSQP